ncbi:MAG: Rieske 2Fe-2S domain-containing protein, partial [Bacteroidota bacterium]|nr:Rieske 2Fe-2S domain-containing protein [Bacteroidota bacterium]
MNIEEKSSLKQLIKSQKPNFPLEQRFYMDPTIFNLDMETFFFNQWIIVGHESKIPEKGNYFLFNIENESIIIIRDDNGKVNCFYNVCRHRGSKICLENEGSTKNLVCPYHAWSYKLDGSLKSARL